MPRFDAHDISTSTGSNVLPMTERIEIDKTQTLIWIDLEMTGLVPEADRIIEIATLITDGELNILAEGPTIAVHQSEATLACMDEWNQTTHGKSGLIDRVKHSAIGESEAERLTLEFLQQYSQRRGSPMCGNSICQDRRFLARYMPTLEDFFHYRNLDVSTVKELARRWAPDVLRGVSKQSSHQAMDDIRDSVSELRHYREQFFRF
jgi:oligoribonuclease